MEHTHFTAGLRLRDDQGTVYIGKQTGEEGGRLLFSFENENLSASVDFVRQKDGLWCRVEAHIATQISYDRQNAFAAVSAVELILQPSADRVVGSYYFLKEKNDCWASPFFCPTLGEIPERTASVLWQREDTYYHMLPLCDEDCKSEIGGDGESVVIRVSPYTGGFTTIRAATFALSWGQDPFALPERTAQIGFAALGLRPSLRKDKQLPQVFQYLGWCSWDGFGKEVSAQGLEAKAAEFREKGIPVKWMLIDDGWFCYDGFLLTDIQEDRKKFSQGLKACIDTLKQTYAMDWVGVWQCFIGYWAGIHPESALAKEHRDITFQTNGGAVLPSPEEGKNFAFWNWWNRYLSSCGVDFVKVDVENSLASYTYQNMSIGKAARGAHAGLEGSVGMFYDGACIHCTGMGHESIWNRPRALVNRNSVDFAPQDPESMRLFVLQNLYNSLYHGAFYYLDWDMMWSDSPTTKLNVVLHSLCAGPVYLSDPVGASKAETVMPFVLPDGRVLRCDRAAVPTEDMLFRDVEKTPGLVKAYSTVGQAVMLGVFQLFDVPLPAEWIVIDFPGQTQEEYLVYEWFSQKAQVIPRGGKIKVQLEEYDAALYCIVPVSEGLAVLGLADKYVCTAAVKSVRRLEDEVEIVLYAGGNFAFYAKENSSVSVNGKSVQESQMGALRCVDCSHSTGETVVRLQPET